MTPWSRYRWRLVALVMGALVAGVLVWCAHHNYVVFHSLVELFSIGVACGMFMVAWNTRRFLENHAFLFLGIGFLFIAVLDLVHMLTYRGMSVVPGATTNDAIQLWIAARGLEGASLLIAPVFAVRKVRVWPVMLAYGTLTALALMTILWWPVFPVCFVDGVGLTPFKIACEYAVCLLLLGAAVFLVRRRGRFHPPVLRLLVAAALITVASEFCFTLYQDPYSIANMIGHLLKLLSFYLIYRAVIQETLANPYSALFQGLQTARDELFTVFDNSPVAMMLLDENREVRRANRQAVKARAYAQFPSQGGPPGDVLACIHAIEEPQGCGRGPHCVECVVRRTVNRTFAEGRDYSRQEGTMTTGGGERRITRNLLVSTILLHVAGAPMVLVCVEDVTELKEAEAELQRHRHELEALVTARTGELRAANVRLLQEVAERRQAEEARRTAERQLEEQRMLALRSERLRSLGEMAAGIAHELNQPLSGVRGLAEHLLIGMRRGWSVSPDRVQEKLQLVVDQADRMSHIIGHVRMFARDAGKPELQRVDLNEVIKSSLTMIGQQLRDHGIELSCELAEVLPPVRANPFSLEEVVLNLMSNARDAVETRVQRETDIAPRIAICTAVDMAGPQRRVRVRVVDNGVGIALDTFPRLFDPFFTTKAPDKGLGLGMSISKAIVESVGGTIDVTSEVGQGTTVTVSLPVSEQEEAA